MPYMRHEAVLRERWSPTPLHDGLLHFHEALQMRLLFQMIALGDVRKIVWVDGIQPCQEVPAVCRDEGPCWWVALGFLTEVMGVHQHQAARFDRSAIAQMVPLRRPQCRLRNPVLALIDHLTKHLPLR